MGDENKDTESIIEEMSGVSIIGRVPELKEINKETVKACADVLAKTYSI